MSLLPYQVGSCRFMITVSLVTLSLIRVPHFAALENASVETKVLPRVTIIAIVLVVILAALLFLLAVGCCLCRSGRRHGRRNRARDGGKHAKAACDDRNRLRRQSSAADMGCNGSNCRDGKDGAAAASVFGKYRHEAAAAADVYFKSPFELQTDSSSADSRLDYRALARSLSMPHHEAADLPNLPNGDIPGRGRGSNNRGGGSSCSLHLLQYQQGPFIKDVRKIFWFFLDPLPHLSKFSGDIHATSLLT